MGTDSEREIKGRLILWLGALGDCLQCLKLCDRMSLTSMSIEVRRQELDMQEHFELITGRSLSPLTAYPNDQQAMDSFERFLPTVDECGKIIYHLQRLAVVYFLQLYTRGNSVGGVVLGNMTKESIKIRTEIEKTAFPDPLEFDRFQCLKAVLLEFRHGEIAHADGDRLMVRHDETATSNAVSFKVNGINPANILEMQQLIPKLHEAVWNGLGSRTQPQFN